MAFYRGYSGYKAGSLRAQLRRRKRAAVANMSRAAAGKSATIRKYGTPFRPTLSKLSRSIVNVKRHLRGVVEREVFYYMGINSTTAPVSLNVPQIQLLINPSAWTRTFALFGGTAVAQKSHVLVKKMTFSAHWNLVGASVGSYKIYFYIVKPTRQANSVFQNGNIAGSLPAAWQQGVTHLSNVGNMNMILNRDLFKVLYSRVFLIGSELEGVPPSDNRFVSNLKDSGEIFYKTFLFKNFNLKSEADSWSTISESALPNSQKIYYIWWSTRTGDLTSSYTSPRLYWQCKFDLECAN